MKAKLYGCFEHWYHGGAIYFYSDPHFDDRETNAFIKNRPTANEQVKMINKKLGKNDTIVILGDIGNKEWLKKIRGYKVLVLGNHDAGASTYEGYADEIYDGPVMINNKILLSHEPILGLPFIFNIHGHDHGNRTHVEYGMNICAEFINYTPVGLKDIIKGGLLKNVKDIHRTAIDRQIDRKKHWQDEKSLL